MHAHPPDTPADTPAEHDALLRATETMLEEVARKRREEFALDRQLRGVRIQLQALMAPLTAALGALPEEARAGPRARLAEIEAEFGAEPRRLGITPASDALLNHLATCEAESVTAGEVQDWLERAGHAPRYRYAALALARLHDYGVVTRRRVGTYAIHRFHPELVARRMKAAAVAP